jgi:hypothetical protein
MSPGDATLSIASHSRDLVRAARFCGDHESDSPSDPTDGDEDLRRFFVLC